MSKNRKENTRKKLMRDARTEAKKKVAEARKWLKMKDMDGVRRALGAISESARLGNYGWHVCLSTQKNYIKTNGLYC